MNQTERTETRVTYNGNSQIIVRDYTEAVDYIARAALIGDNVEQYTIEQRTVVEIADEWQPTSIGNEPGRIAARAAELRWQRGETPARRELDTVAICQGQTCVEPSHSSLSCYPKYLSLEAGERDVLSFDEWQMSSSDAQELRQLAHDRQH